MKLLLDQGERVRHGLETQVRELQDKLKKVQSPEPAKEVLRKVGSFIWHPILCFASARASSKYGESPLVCFQTDPVQPRMVGFLYPNKAS